MLTRQSILQPSNKILLDTQDFFLMSSSEKASEVFYDFDNMTIWNVWLFEMFGTVDRAGVLCTADSYFVEVSNSWHCKDHFNSL